MRIPLLRREPAAYVKLRRLGYSINQIARAFGRSRSVVWRRLKFNGLNRRDLRKLPARVRLLAAQRQRISMGRWLHLWEMWVLGEGEEPP
jgi:IS30 family transposase